ncbi:nitrilase-related carbon-nitrogen hydrolase [uncultured Castellaniella sp.]|uniref:nitrilase-related carbon-nitrogen hydrolase n=1 Tax=uncultured Castellaniella sp. TaxID=647907 RepID=UPI00260E341C|nr:nitrilase-related carbon-nitrogen hydrolase [uncultured Castellaniella sp.]
MTDAPCLRTAVAQIEGRCGDVAHNLGLHLTLIEEARAQQADLLLFPELSLTGYSLGDAALSLARRADHAIIRELATAAQGIDVVFGFVEEAPAAQLYNVMAVARDGAVRFVHRKINLPTYGGLEEGKLYAAGRHVDICPIRGPWKAGLLICADLWNPALVHLAMLQGATVLLAPISSALGAVGGDFSNPQGWDLATRFYAMMYGTPILMSNRLGQENDTRFWGGSRILDPQGQVLARAPEGKTGLAFADLDYDAVRRARFNLPTLRDSNPELNLRELQRILDNPDRPRTSD